jgi:hypothetical protein
MADHQVEPEIKVSCTVTSCKDGLHYFGPTGRDKATREVNSCKDCGADLVDWKTPRARSDERIGEVISMLQLEWIRHHYWHHHPLNERQKNYARRKGLAGLRARAESNIRKKVCVPNPQYWNYMGTPYDGTIVDCAQHATATCCPRCVEYWHGIKEGKVPSDGDVNYLVELIMRYVRTQMPDLS